MFKITPKFLLLFLFVVLCLAAGSAGAEEEPVWPVETELMYKDAMMGSPLTLDDVGDVKFWNTRDDCTSLSFPAKRLMIEEVAIHVVDDPADFERVLDKKGKPKAGKLRLQTDYLGIRTSRRQPPGGDSPDDLIRSKRTSAGGSPEKCPPNRYIIVASTSRRDANDDGKEIWENIPETAYTENEGSTASRHEAEEAVLGLVRHLPAGQGRAGALHRRQRQRPELPRRPRSPGRPATTDSSGTSPKSASTFPWAACPWATPWATAGSRRWTSSRGPTWMTTGSSTWPGCCRAWTRTATPRRARSTSPSRWSPAWRAR